MGTCWIIYKSTETRYFIMNTTLWYLILSQGHPDTQKIFSNRNGVIKFSSRDSALNYLLGKGIKKYQIK